MNSFTKSRVFYYFLDKKEFKLDDSILTNMLL